MTPHAWLLSTLLLATPSIGLQEAIELAERRSPAVQVAQAQLDLAAAGVSTAGVLPNPQLMAGTIHNSFHFTTSISQPMVLFGQRSLGIEQARYRRDAASGDKAQALLSARLQASDLWLQLWLNERLCTVRTQTQARYDRLLQMTKERFDDGASAQVEVIRATAAAARAQAEQLSSVALVRAATADLQGFITPNMPIDAELHTSGELPASRPPPAIEGLWGQLEAHPAVARLRATAEADRSAVRLERRRRLPIVNLNVGYSVGASSSPSNELQAGLSAEIPIFHLRGAYIAQQQAAFAASDRRAQMALAQQRTALSAALQTLAASQNRAQSLATQALPAAEKAAQLAAEAFSEGASDMTSVLAVEQVLADTRLEVALALAEQFRAQVMAEYLLGEPL